MNFLPTVIIGLGNPGQSYYYQRHSIGFRVLDALAARHNAVWKTKGKAEIAQIELNGAHVLLVKPQTYMNNSGDILSGLPKQVKPADILVVHDELEMPFGKVTFKLGGSARGHNGLKSIIARIGPEFYRLRVGIDRPENKHDVPDYVLSPFGQSAHDVDMIIEKAVDEIISHSA